MREIEFKEATKKGERALGAYFDFYNKSWPKAARAEFAVENVKVGKIMIRGRLDRVDLLGDARVRVVDYKLKKPMSRNEIAGKTRSMSSGQAKKGHGNYYRQLVFYKLLIEEGTKWNMQDAMIDFLEPDIRGKFKQEVFAPSSAEVAELKKEIKRVSEEILALEFLNKKCEDKECKYCTLIQHGRT